MVLSALLFSLMGVGVKWASTLYSAAEIVMYRGLVGALLIGLVIAPRRRVSLRTRLPWMHFGRSATGVASLLLWFEAIAGLPLATAITLNYMSSVWMAVFLFAAALLPGPGRRNAVDPRILACVLAGFGGVALVLRPSLNGQGAWPAIAGLASGVLAALAYLQIAGLGRAGEPETRVVFYFALGGIVAGVLVALAGSGLSAHTPRGLALLLGIGLLATTAQLAMTRAYAIGLPLTNAALQYLGIVFACLFGVALFGDTLAATTLAGMALIILAGIGATRLRAQPHDR